jgi:hypothetical protein
MKRIAFTLCFILTVCISFGQTKADHLIFKGVPLDGTLDEYILRMKKSGFTLLSMEDGFALMTGDFAGYKDCSIGVSTLKQKDLVHKIGVLFPKSDKWSTLSGNYFDLKQMLTEKYGKPVKVVEKFTSNSSEKDDDSKMYDVKFDRCKYYSIWETDNGDIQLSIDHEGVMSCFVKLVYFDNINSATVKKHAFDDL